MTTDQEVYRPSPEIVAAANVKSYEEMARFWAQRAQEFGWFKPRDKALDDPNKASFHRPSARVSTTTQEIIQQALETVSTQQVLAWCKEKFGRSVQSKRREVLAALGGAEQKWDQWVEGA